MYRVNNKGPNTDPCGTPIAHFMLLDSASQTLRHCILFDKYEDIHASALDEKCLNCNSKNYGQIVTADCLHFTK